MPNLKKTERKNPPPPNPFRRAGIPGNHPMVWILELILAEVDRQVTQKMEQAQVVMSMGKGDTEPQGTYLSMHVEPATEQVPKNILETEKESETPSTLERLQTKVKENIAVCREPMAKQKQTESFMYKHGNLPARRGRGKFGPKRRKIETPSVTSSSPVREGPLIGNTFQALRDIAPEFKMTDNEEGLIGGLPQDIETRAGRDPIQQRMASSSGARNAAADQQAA